MDLGGQGAFVVTAAPTGEPDQNRCPDCREKGVVVLRYEVGPSVAVHEGAAPTGTLVLVRYGQRWGVRDLADGEWASSKVLRRRHECRPHPHKCLTPRCVFPARLFAGGTFCEDHRP